MIDYTILGIRIKAWRELRYISQQKLAEMTGISKATISSLERGAINNMSLNVLERIAESLGCSLANLMKEASCKTECEYEDDEEAYLRNTERTYYQKNQYPYHKISNLMEFILILPLVDSSTVLDCCCRIAGDIFGKEDYLLKQLDYMVNSISDSPGKAYVDYMFNLMDKDRENADGLDIQRLRDKCCQDMEKSENFAMYTNYLKDIQKRWERINCIESFITEMKAIDE